MNAGDVQALGERPAGHLDQRGPGASRELPSDRERLRQSIPGGLRCGDGNPGRHRAGQNAAVDGHPDAAEHGDPQRASELGGGLRDARRGSRSLRRGGADDQVVRQREQGRGAQGEQHRPQDDLPEPRAPIYQREHREPRRGHDQPTRHQGSGTDPAGDDGRHVRADHESQGPGQRPQACLERREIQHQLQVLRQEQEAAEHQQDADPVGGQRGAERGLAEQLEVDERIGQPSLPAHEHHAEGQSRHDAQGRQPRHARAGRSA